MEVYVDDQRLIRATEEPRIFTQFHIPVGAAYACRNNSLNIYKPASNSFLAPELEYVYRFYGIEVSLLNQGWGSNSLVYTTMLDSLLVSYLDMNPPTDVG